MLRLVVLALIIAVAAICPFGAALPLVRRSTSGALDAAVVEAGVEAGVRASPGVAAAREVFVTCSKAANVWSAAVKVSEFLNVYVRAFASMDCDRL